MGELKGKVALITGAGRVNGIGAAIARKLGEQGADIVISDLCSAPPDLPNPGIAQWEEMEAVAQQIEALGVHCTALQADVTHSEMVRGMLAKIKEEFGRLDILVNNAGMVVGPAPIMIMAEEAWRKTIEINATGTFLVTQAALPLMVAGGQGGRIVNISSLAARKPRPFLSAYAASKAAVVALTRSLAQEIGEHGITANAILPGDIDTTMKQWGLGMEALVTGRPQEQVTADLVARIPAGRIGVPEDVANLVAFLCSKEASFITGQAYNLTGGRELS